ncbi:laccase-13-like isoform X2 [Diospyros lotus]|uniref:laccase-13-like isoform X2 n=1 Tax=Diospyros lotus TaxID=55363 RepID=UPI00225A87B2|nr:laccase-13-like isoform X2 [Diospyros lotus]
MKDSKFCLNLWCNVLFLILLVTFTNAETHYHEFVVQATAVKRLCRTQNIITVNGQYPGPTLEVRNGDTLVVKVINSAQYNATIHWHGIRQMGTPWADGPEYVTQCPIQPGAAYTYHFTVKNQEGTLWWHAHSRWLRATVFGALIIYPKLGVSYPFPQPTTEIPILLGEWWNSDPMDVLRQALFTGAAPNVSDAYTINGQPGDLYRCSNRVANHKLTVVGADAAYTMPFTTRTLMLGPGQTTNVLLTADQTPGRYYIAARAYASARNAQFDNTTATAILEYKSALCSARKGFLSKPTLPQLPAYNDTATVAAFTTQFRSPSNVKVPIEIDEDLFLTVGLGFVNCNPGPQCQGPNNTRFAASMNNVSFVLPSTTSLLQAYYQGIPGVFTTDFPAVPPIKFDYTGSVSRALWQPTFGTKLYRLKFGSRVQIVLQDTAIFSTEDHPIHLHGYHFYVIAQGFGNYDSGQETANFNLIDPPKRNTIDVPAGGWAVIRFVADNPGAWLMHCHIDSHLTWGLATVFLVENGAGQLQSIESPPADLPPC